MMESRVVLLANVAVLWLHGLARIGLIFALIRLNARRWQRIGREEHRPASQFTDAASVQNRLFALKLFQLSLADPGFDEPALFSWIRQENVPCCLEQAG